MKKSLIALAALATVGAAQAQSSVTVYGLMDMGYSDRAETNASSVKAQTRAVASGVQATSRLGFRGTEDLGGGKRVSFLLETGLTPFGAAAITSSSTSLTQANGGVSVGDRGAWVELSDAKLGALRVGRQNTGARDIFLSFDPSVSNVLGALHSSTAADSGDSTDKLVGAHTAFSTGVKYTAPTINGLTVSASANTNRTDYSDNSPSAMTGEGYSLGAAYAVGKFAAAYSYGKSSTGAKTAATDTSRTVDAEFKITAAAASYDFTVAKLSVIHMKAEQVDKQNPTAAFAAAGTGNYERSSTSVALSAPVAGKHMAYIMAGDGKFRTGASSAYEGDLKALQMGLRYNLSKRTALWAVHGQTQRDVSATTQVKAKETGLTAVHQF